MSFSMYRRSISSRATLLAARFHPSFSHVIVKDDEKRRPPATNQIQPQTSGSHVHKFHSDLKSFCIRNLFQCRKNFASSLPASLGPSFWHYYSSTTGEMSEDMTYMTDVTELLAEKSTEVVAAQSSLVNEVAIAAADSAYPVAALQYLIDGVHSFTGLNWWASIMITTILIRTATVPLLINTMKATTKLSQVRPKLEEIRQQMLDSMDPKAIAEGQKKMKAVLNEHKVSPYSPLKGLFIQGPIFISFFFAISNMVEKVPSFKTGGALWFTDLTTIDSLYMLPVLTASSFLLTVELNAQEGMEGNPVGGTVKNVLRVVAVLTIPFTMNFPKAIFFYWFTSNLFSLCYGQVIKRPPVKRLLGIPELVVPPRSQSPSIPLFGRPNSVIGKVKAVLEQGNATPPSTSQAPSDKKSKFPERKVSSSAVISQRIGNLEKAVKGRKKSKK